MVGNDGRPQQKKLLEILQEWLSFRQLTLTRRSQYRLRKVDERMHILEGRIVILISIDKAIKIIRHSDEPKAALIEAFHLSERQAEDILEIRLRQLARLEALKIEQELSALKEEKSRLEALLATDAAMKKCMIKEIEADAKQFGDNRRTLIQAEQKAVAEVKLIDEPVTVVLSQNGWVRVRPGHGVDISQLGFKAGDQLYAIFPCRTVDTLVMLDHRGRAYSIAVANLPGGRGDGVPVASLIDLQPGARIAHSYAGSSEQILLIASTSGYGFLAKVGDLLSRQRAGKAFLTVAENEQPLPLVPIPANTQKIACLSEKGCFLLFGIDELKLQSGGRGVILMALEKQDALSQVMTVSAAGLIIQGQGRSGKSIQEIWPSRELDDYMGKRARKGKRLDKKWTQLKLLAIETTAVDK